MSSVPDESLTPSEEQPGPMPDHPRSRHSSDRGSQHRVDIMDGLRGVAITQVVLYHYWQMSWVDLTELLHSPISLNFIQRSGNMGVEVFLFVSGFCLFYPYARRFFEAVPRPTIKAFYAKRFFKIVPSYVLGMGLFLLAFGWNFGAKQLAFHLITHLLFIHNWFFETYGSINGVLWTLAVEVQFYIIFPIVCGVFRRYPINTFAAMIFIGVIYRHWVYLSNFNANLAVQGDIEFSCQINQLPGFIDLLACGMMAAYTIGQLRKYHPKLVQLSLLWTLIALLSLMVLIGMLRNLGSISELRETMHWQVHFRHFFGLILLAFTVSATFSLKIFRMIFANKIITFLSAISYNLYLWHQAIGQKLIDLKIPHFSTSLPPNDLAWRMPFLLMALPLSLIVATVLTYKFEQPIIRWGNQLMKRKKLLT